ncbi:MAG: TPM domain-containing protein [Methylomonas sp.]|jgi:putative membrane protein
MKKLSSAEFRTRLWSAVKAVEQASQVELVVVARSRSASYAAVPLAWGGLCALLAHTYIVYAPDYFENWLVYYGPLAAFIFGFAAGHAPAVIRFSSQKSVLQRNVEIMARALFQKVGVYHTQAKIGVLVYCSQLEKTVYILPDRGAEMALPTEDWAQLRAEFQAVYRHGRPDDALLAALDKTRALFGHYLPALAHDINELPDIPEIDL